MALTELEIERVREIIGHSSLPATRALLAALTPVQETETSSDVDEWDRVRSSFITVDSRKSDFGVGVDKNQDRLAIIKRVRVRLGLAPFADSKQQAPDPSFDRFSSSSVSIVPEF